MNSTTLLIYDLAKGTAMLIIVNRPLRQLIGERPAVVGKNRKS